MAEPPRPHFWPHGYPQGHYVQHQLQPQMLPVFHGPGDARPHFFAGLAPAPPFAPHQQQQMYSGGQMPHGPGAYRPWGSPAFAPPHYGSRLHPPPGSQVRPGSPGFGSQMMRPEFGRPKEFLGNPRPVLSSSSTRGNGQLLKESCDLLLVELGDGKGEADSDVLKHPEGGKGVDLKSIMTEVQELILRVEKGILQPLQSVGSVSATQLPKLVTCPSDPHHRVPPGALFEHIFRCPSSPLTFLQDSYSRLSELNYRSIEEQAKGPQVTKVGTGCSDVAVLSSSQNPTDITTKKNKPYDPWGGHFLYSDAPAVVQGAQSGVCIEGQHIATRPSFVAVELGSENYSTLTRDRTSTPGEPGKPDYFSNNFQLRSILPSSFWLLKKEVDAWKAFPRSYSASVAKALLGLAMVKRSDIIEWLLMNSPYYGIVLDVAIAKHVSCLVIIALRAMQRESLGHTHGVSQTFRTELFEASGNWLASQLEILYSKGNAKSFALAAFRHSLLSSGQMLVSPFMRPGQRDAGRAHVCVNDEQCIEKVEFAENLSVDQQASQGLEQGSTDAANGKLRGGMERVYSDGCDTSSSLLETSQKSSGDAKQDESILDDIFQESHIESALAALQERVALEQCLGAMMASADHTAAQLLQDHEAIVSIAVAARLNRPHMRAVLEHDGLVWNRNQQQGEKKNKTKEELLAEERDYKRRRMSYKGKKVRRTPTQVLHDIIEGHMHEITVAGGIGCFIKDGPPAKGEKLVNSVQTESPEAGKEFRPSKESAPFKRQDELRFPRDMNVPQSGRGDGGMRSPPVSAQSINHGAHRDFQSGQKRRYVPEHRGSERSAHDGGSSRFEQHHYHSGERYDRDRNRWSEQCRSTSPADRLAGSQFRRSSTGGKEDRWEGGSDREINHQYQGSSKGTDSERHRTR